MIAVVLACPAWTAEPKQKAGDAETTAARLVRAALESELAGHNDQREALLHKAIGQSPNERAAHWQLGQVRMDGVWQSLADVGEAARQDQRLAEYARRREACGSVAADQAALARWCRKNHLDDQQRVHWMWTLQLEPDNAEAIRALGLRPYGGMMLTQGQIERLKGQTQAVRKAMDRWRPLVAQWSRAADRGDPALPAPVREKLSKISDAAEMVGLEGALWQQVGAKHQRRPYHDMVLAMALALGDNPQPVAAESLARSAVFSGSKDIVAAAVRGLKRHPLDHYVPLLLSGLQSPIEARVQWTFSPAGDPVMRYSIFQEGALADVSRSLMVSPFYSSGTSPFLPPVSVTPGTGTVVFDSPKEKQSMMRNYPAAVAASYAQARADAAAVPQLAAAAIAQAVMDQQIAAQKARRRRLRIRPPLARRSIAPIGRLPNATPKSRPPSARPPAWRWATSRQNGGPGGGRITTSRTRSAAHRTQTMRTRRTSPNTTMNIMWNTPAVRLRNTPAVRAGPLRRSAPVPAAAPVSRRGPRFGRSPAGG